MSNATQELPLLSICVPTYNRAHFLQHLLTSMQEVRVVCGNAIELCFSNNCSTDNTAELIAEWTPKLNLRSITQSENVGSTRNIIAVTRLARGRWIHIVGDDDTLYAENYLKLLEVLRSAEPETWVLTEVVAGESRGVNLIGLKDGDFTVRSFRKITLRTGIVRYGFIGQHVFPADHVEAFNSLPVEAFNLWAHIGLLLRHLGREGRVLVWRLPVVRQAGGGAGLFWSADDWARLQLCRWIIVHYAKQGTGRAAWFYNVLIMREMYGVVGLKIPISWKLHEPKSFNKSAIGTYWTACDRLGWIKVMAFPLILLLLFLRVVSLDLLNYSPLRSYLEVVRGRYRTEKNNLSNFDGMKREGEKSRLSN